MKKMIKLFDPVSDTQEENAILKTINSKFWASGAGIGNVSKFEKEFNKYIGSDHCVAVNSGTAALHLALSLLPLKGREVILPSLSFVSTAHSVLYNGGKPVFVDVDPDTLCIDSQCIRESITRNTRLVLPVHFGGMPCDLKEIVDLCKNYKLGLIEDAAHAAGSKYKNQKIGKHGTAVCFSFHPVKNLAMPTGGAITLNGTKSGKFRKILESLRWCGISDRKGPKYDVSRLGWNYYMNEFSAAIGLIQLKKLDKHNLSRRKIATSYSKEINLERKMPYNENCSYHLFWIQVKDRKKFMKKMSENKIETGIHYMPIHKMTLYKNKSKLPKTDEISKHIVSLPIHPNLKEDDIEKIIKLTNKFS